MNSFPVIFLGGIFVCLRQNQILCVKVSDYEAGSG
jgi:hypothetical protein